MENTLTSPPIIRPQEGFQMKFLSSSADIVIGGSAAGVGKTYALLLEFPRHIDNPGWGGVIFRRTSPQIKLEGGLWDTSMSLYPLLNAEPRESTLEWLFPNAKEPKMKGAKLKFAHLEYNKNVLDYQGAQIPFIGFDELTHFSEHMFFYLLSRNRSTCGIKPYVRATCNPDPESWVAKLVEWWIDQETGFPIPERDGVVRYFMRNGDKYTWGDTVQEVLDKSGFIIDKLAKENNINPREFVKSITFVSGSIYHNMELLKVNPGYLANLMSQDEATRSSLLDGNWKFVESDKDIYDYAGFLGMFEEAVYPNSGKRRIIVDVALQGSNKFIVSVFDGRFLLDMAIVDKSNGQEIINMVKGFQTRYYVANARVLYDADGVGGFIDGFIPGAIAFHGNASVLPTTDSISGKTIKENYMNLKTQLIYHSGRAVSKGLYKVSEYVSSLYYNEEMNVRQRMIFERKAFKKDKVDDGKQLKVISKEQMKEILLGESPDIMDTFFMNEYFEITIKTNTSSGKWSGALA